MEEDEAGVVGKGRMRALEKEVMGRAWGVVAVVVVDEASWVE